MLLIPAIDLKDGQCVRLRQGDMDESLSVRTDMCSTRVVSRTRSNKQGPFGLVPLIQGRSTIYPAF